MIQRNYSFWKRHHWDNIINKNFKNYHINYTKNYIKPKYDIRNYSIEPGNIINIIKNLIFNKPKTVNKHLGRWNNNDSDSNNKLKIDYANLDSCGDKLCGNPDHFKKKK